MKGNFDNSLKLTKFLLRRERVISSVWILVLTVVVVGLVVGMYEAIPYADRDALISMFENPALVAMMGPNYATLADGFGAMYTTLMLLWTALTVGLMNIFLIVRNTRADEEKGRFEVLRSLPVGRLANLNAAFITALIVNVILALVVGLGMFAVGDVSMDLSGSLLWGAALGAIGLVFAAFAGLFSQLSSNSRGAMGYSFAALGFFYLLRAPGDMNPDLEILSRISPLGLVLRTQAYAGNYWWPILILIVVAVVVAAVAYRLNYLRDIEQGIIPARPGRADGSILMRTPTGFTFRLLKVSLIIWFLSMFSFAGSYGTVLGEVDEFIANNEMYQQLMLGPAGVEFVTEAGLSSDEIVDILRAAVAAEGFTLPELFASTINNIMAIFALVPVLLFILKVKSEEKDTRAELVLATPVCRYKYIGGYAAIAFIFAIIIPIAYALGIFLVGQPMMANPEDLTLGFLLQSNLLYIPASWFMIGLTIFLIGLKPKAVGLIWGYFAFSFLIMFFGRMEIFPAWTEYLSPFGWIPLLPMDEVTVLPLVVLTTIAVVLTGFGFYFYRNRDINAITH